MNFIPSCFQYKSAYFKNSELEDEAREIIREKCLMTGKSAWNKAACFGKRLEYFQSTVEKKKKKKRM